MDPCVTLTPIVGSECSLSTVKTRLEKDRGPTVDQALFQSAISDKDPVSSAYNYKVQEPKATTV